MTLPHVSINNIGQHDLDNSYLLKPIVPGKSKTDSEIEYWKSQNEDCIPIGFCEECFKKNGDHKFIAFVFEMFNGNRYYVHVPEEWKQFDFLFE